jgi:SpoIID/LytB domain protein
MKWYKKPIIKWGSVALAVVTILLIVSVVVAGNPEQEDRSTAEVNRVARESRESLDDEFDYRSGEAWWNESYLSGGGGGSPTGSPDTQPEEVEQPVQVDLSGLLTSRMSSSQSGIPVPGGDATFVFTARGRAHGVGLCMDGVRYRAEAGHSYLDIINHYYTGVQLGSIDDGRLIRVKGRDGQIRQISMKDYLYRLAEEPDDYPMEGLKVLFVAARTYTLSCINRGKHTAEGYDVCSSGGCCQAFSETKDLSRYPNHIAAVDATGGQIITYGGQPIVAAYCGSCGGHTDSYEDVWGGQPLPYLRGKPDAYCSRSPRFETTVEISVSELSGKLGVGTIELIDLSDRTPGGRVKNARLAGSSGSKTVPGRDLQKILGLPSTLYDYSFK